MKDDLIVKNGITIPEHELRVSASRSGGPGGQHVNKTSSRITVQWNVRTTTALTDAQKERLMHKLRNELSKEGELTVHNGSTRSQVQNKKLALTQLKKKVRNALHVPKRRMKTRVPKGAKEGRLQAKKQRSEVKKLRSKADF